jgi:hypothetical protein
MTIPTPSLIPEPQPGEKPPRLSEEVERLIVLLQEKSLVLAEMIAVLHGRAYNLLLIILALPFCTPIPLPGLSTPFGWIIAIIGARLGLAQKPWLPRRMLELQIKPAWMIPVLRAVRRVARGLEFLLRPRLSWLADYTPLHRLYGAMILTSGLLLLLPLPIPFSNLLPSATVVLLASGMLERDGAAIIGGVAAFAVTLAFFALIFWGGAEAVQWIRAMVGDWFEPVD